MTFTNPSSTSDIEKRFASHACDEDQCERMAKIREMTKELALVMAEVVPPGRELASALTNLEHSMFWANAGIARHPKA